ncbi:MAG: radical SAM protein [Chloroflexi bacterium]|nr:radical SAM protein [Chloroflexota bacterium]
MREAAMLGVSQLLAGTQTETSHLRYGEQLDRQPRAERRPVVVWTVSRRCNLHCMHCYSDSFDHPYQGELTTREAGVMLADLAAFGVPALLLSGGEPLLRPDLFELAEEARSLGLRITLSTNGTMITPETARRIKDIGFGYVGISLDGIGPHHDKFRGKRGAFDEALAGVRNCLAAGQRVGLRLTLTRRTVADLPAIFQLIEDEGIQRACFYHLVAAGRGRRIYGDQLSPQELRTTVESIFAQAETYAAQGKNIELLTVDNHADGALRYLKALRGRGPSEAERIRGLLRRNGGNSSGVAIGHIDNLGDIHPDQFTWGVTLGNVRLRPFSEVWTDLRIPAMAALKDRTVFLPKRCQGCRFLDMCNGNLRARPWAAAGDLWGMDPACYLTDEEIAPVAGEDGPTPAAVVRR